VTKSEKGICLHCGKETPSPAVPYCQDCFLMELRKFRPKIRFLDKDGKETEKIEEAVSIRGVKLRKKDD